MDRYDVAVIGAGPGGYVAAIRAAQLGLKVALIEERATLGGTCLNVGCIPSKALLESSELFAAARDKFVNHGIEVGKPTIDIATMMKRKSSIVGQLVDGVALLMKKNKVAVLNGRGRLVATDRIAVDKDGDTTEIEASNTVLAMGSAPVELPFLPFDGERVVSSTEALSFSKAPKRLLVVGAGAVGLELGSVWNRLGSQVTVVEMLPQITPFADKQIAGSLQRSLAAQGIDFRLKTRLVSAKVLKTKVKATLEDDTGEMIEQDADTVLVSVGRRPVTDTAGLEDVGVKLDEAGRVSVDDQLRTEIPNIYAIGDLVRGPMLAHKAEDEGIAVAETIAGKPGHVNLELVPNVVYTEPELAMVGRTEAELKEAGTPFNTGRFMFRANGRAKSIGIEDGMVKILAHKETDEILGVHMIGPRTSELIGEAVAVMEFKGSAEDLARTCHAHPTLSEVVREAALAVDKRAIHG